MEQTFLPSSIPSGYLGIIGWGVNLVIFIYNLVQRQKIVNLQTSDQVIKTLTDQLNAKITIEQEHSREIIHFRGQIHILTMENERLKAANETYKGIHTRKLMETPSNMLQ